MTALAKARIGKPVIIRKRQTGFSYWPTYRTKRRYGLHTHIYASNPWALIHASVRAECPAPARPEALSSLEQAEFFYRSAERSREWAAKPLPLYYCFMNIAKAFALTRSIRAGFDQARHGLAERLAEGGVELSDAHLEVYPSTDDRKPNVFADFCTALGAPPITKQTTFKLHHLIPQVLPGHRFWCDAADAAERFLAIDSFPLLYSTKPKSIWGVLTVLKDDVDRMGLTRKELLKLTRLATHLREVDSRNNIATPPGAITFEQLAPVTFTGRPADKLAALVATLRPYVWSTAITIRPFRRYYLYASPSTEHAAIVPQAASLFAITFYLGSITRYRPQHFSRIMAGSYGEFFQEFLSTQPAQFLYLMASDFAKRDVARAPLV